MGMVAGHRPAGAGPFSSRDLKLLQAAARQVGLVLRNSHLAAELAQVFVATVRGLAAAIDAKDPYTRGHSDRVACLASDVAQHMQLPLREQRDLVLASLLHDVGKIGVPEAVLQKSGALDAQEWQYVREHPERGATIVSEVEQLRRLVPGIRHHHERFDGEGYPAGIMGHEIPLAARIIGACDAYDAMTSARPYRRPRSPREAETELVACSGSQFDPAVVSALLAELKESPRLAGIESLIGTLGSAYRLGW
jgi:HD-GYP domain-containing protein (c-di-GMP phosphodiesterase class II)